MTGKLNFYRMTTKNIQVNLILDYLIILKMMQSFLGHSGSRNLATQTTPVSDFCILSQEFRDYRGPVLERL